MTVTVFGNGTVTGISAGGLPDGCIQSADLASGTGGKVLQVVHLASITELNTASSSYIEMASDFRPAITPTSTNSTIHIMLFINISGDVDTDAHGSVWGQFKIEKTIGGVTTVVKEVTNSSIASGGHMRTPATAILATYANSATNAIVFNTYVKRVSGSRNILCSRGGGHYAQLMEVAN
jgi:hypothetical protein